MGNPEYIEEEINLHDMLRVVLKRKKIIISIFIFIVSCTVIITFLRPKTYEVQAVLQRGFLNEPILNYPETAAILRARYFLKPIFKKLDIIHLLDEDLKKSIIIENIKETNYFTLKVRLKDNDLGYSLIQLMINDYLEYGNTIYNSRHNSIKNYISQIESLIEKTNLSMEKNILVKKESILPLSYPDDKVQLRDLLAQKFQLENQLLFARDKEFKLIEEPVKSKYAIFPKKVLIIISSCIIALIIGIFFAFFAENWEKTSNK